VLIEIHQVLLAFWHCSIWATRWKLML